MVAATGMVVVAGMVVVTGMVKRGGSEEAVAHYMVWGACSVGVNATL